jgi:hypothetical protein
MAARIDVELVTSTNEFAMTTAMIIRLFLLGQAKMLPPQQSTSRQCPNHRLWRDGKPTGSCVPFSNVPRCSRPKAPRLDNMDLSLTSPHLRRHARRKPWSTQNNRERGIIPHLSTPTLVTTTMRATSSTRTKGIRRMEPAAVTTLVGVAATIVGRTGAHRLNPWDRGFLAKTSTTRRSQHGFANLSMSPSTLGKRTPSSGLMTIASPAS